MNTSDTPRRPVPPRGVHGLRGRRDALAEDGVLAAVLAVLAFVPALSKLGAQLGDLPGRPADALSVVLALAQTLPLAARRRFPAAVLAVIGAAFAVDQARGYPTTFASLGLYLALYSAGAHQERLRRIAAAAASAGYAVLALVLHHLGSPLEFGDYFAFYLATAAAWLAGGVMRRLREQQAERRRLAAGAATAAERARIARELHDVVAHNVSVMVVQADGASYALDSEPEKARQALAAIAGTGRQALAEMRRLLGVLRSDDGETGLAPLPGIGQLAELLQQTRATGLAVDFTVEGVPGPLPGGVALAAYRIVQESLTNTRKHGGPSASARVTLRYCEDALVLSIADDGRGAAAAADGAGHGMTGMRERVALYGGTLRAGPRPGGGYQVTARLPLTPGRTATTGQPRGIPHSPGTAAARPLAVAPMVVEATPRSSGAA